MNVVHTLGVDAGNISVADLAYIEGQGGKFFNTAKRMCRKVKVTPGTYRIDISISNCWKGEVETACTVETKGVLVLGDICYLFSSDEVEHDVWLSFLDKTDYLETRNSYFCSLSTGGMVILR